MTTLNSDTAMGELVSRLRRFVGRRVDPGSVDDIVQEVMLRIHRGLANVREPERLGPWIYRITRNAIADHGRALSKASRVAASVQADPEVTEEGSEDGLRNALVRCLAGFVTHLPSPYREAITLTELEGMSHANAAAYVGVSLTAMKSRVRRGREQLRQAFEGCCEVTLDARGSVVGCRPRLPRSS